MEVQRIELVEGSNIFLERYVWGGSPVIYINVHENEQTSVNAGKAVLEPAKGILLSLVSRGERLLTLAHGNREYLFDPNRIFSKAGIHKTLLENGSTHPEVEHLVAQIARLILSGLFASAPKLVVALHNTTGEYCIENYLPGGLYESEAEAVHVQTGLSTENFFYTINRALFETIKTGGFHVILQNNQTVADDGSLSVYCGAHGIPYINIEALHGNTEAQIKMIRFIEGQFAH